MTDRLKVVVFTQSSELFATFRGCVPEALADLQQAKTNGKSTPQEISLAFVDGRWKGDLRHLLDMLSARATYTVLVCEEPALENGVPELLVEGIVDDLLLTPIRQVEVLGKIKHATHLDKVKDLLSVNADLKTLINRFDEDLRTARGVQRALIPEKFAPIHGMRVAHKYLSGLKSGGDYLDFFEFDDKMHTGILMSDSTGYGLSSAFMSVILRLAVRLSKDGYHSPAETIVKIFTELKVTMKPTESLSLFFGIINRKTFELSYASCGSIRLVHMNGERFDEATAARGPLMKEASSEGLVDRKISLHPEDRLIVYSDGFGDALNAEGARAAQRVFAKSYGEDPVGLINELTYRIKSKLETPDDMPEQDCSVMILDVEKRAMRLAR